MSRPIAVYPDTRADMYAACCEAVRGGGATLASLDDAEAMIFADALRPELLAPSISAHPHLAWVQLPYAGIEDFLAVLDTNRIWTNGKDVYSEPVAEHVLALALTACRQIHRYAAATSWSEHSGRNLLGANVTVVGAGGITRALLRLLEPWGCSITVVRRSGTPCDGAHRVLAASKIRDAVADADFVILTLALTPETTSIIDADVLDAMRDDAWLINVARGRHIDTDALVAALDAGHLGGAALDVTHPEPLPDGHPLWQFSNVIITPHLGNTREMGIPLLAARVEENVRRFCAGDELIGIVDAELGY